MYLWLHLHINISSYIVFDILLILYVYMSCHMIMTYKNEVMRCSELPSTVYDRFFKFHINMHIHVLVHVHCIFVIAFYSR